MCPGRDVEDLHGRAAVDLLEIQADVLLVRGRNVLAHEIGADGKLAVTAINENRQLDPARTAKIHDGIERGAV